MVKKFVDMYIRANKMYVSFGRRSLNRRQRGRIEVESGVTMTLDNNYCYSYWH